MNQTAVSLGAPRAETARRLDERLVTPRQLVHAACGLAWFGLLLSAVAQVTDGPAQPAHRHATDVGGGLWQWAVMWTAMWAVMVVAMMWPLTTTGLDVTLRRTYRRWRPGVAAAYLTSYTMLWIVAGLVALGVQLAIADVVPAWVWSSVWLAIAIGVAWSPRRMGLLWSCHRRGVQPAAGVVALTSSARSARKLWQRCALLCGPAMMAMVPMAAGTWTVMVTAAVAVWWEQRHPRAWRDPVPVGLLSIGLLAVLVGAP